MLLDKCCFSDAGLTPTRSALPGIHMNMRVAQNHRKRHPVFTAFVAVCSLLLLCAHQARAQSASEGIPAEGPIEDPSGQAQFEVGESDVTITSSRNEMRAGSLGRRQRIKWDVAGDFDIQVYLDGEFRNEYQEGVLLARGISAEFTQDGKRIVSSGKTDSNKHQLAVWAPRPFDSEASDSGQKPKLNIEVAHEWARKTLEKSRSSFPPNLRGNTSLPLARPVTSLHLFNVSLNDEELGNLAAFPKLKSLTLSGKGITDEGLKNLLTLEKLEMLSLRGTKITDAGIKHLAKLHRLKRLDLVGAKVTHKGIQELATLPNLNELSLEATSIDNDGLQPVRGIKKLRKLNLRNTRVSDEGLRHLAMMPELKEITLQSTRITGDGLHHLATCKSLRTINCWGTEVTNEDLREFRELLPECEIEKTLIE